METNEFEMTIEVKRAVVQLAGLHCRRDQEREKQIEFKKRVELMSDDDIEKAYEQTKTFLDRITIELNFDNIFLY